MLHNIIISIKYENNIITKKSEMILTWKKYLFRNHLRTEFYNSMIP